MDIRTIRYFLEVAKELNFTRAAENLHMAQPPLSRQIQLLEEELGVMLFDRKKRRMELTEEGELLQRRGEQILELVEKTEEEIREYGNTVRGTLYIGSVEGQAPYLLSRWIAQFRSQYPQVQYNLWNGSSDDAISRLKKGLCDLALIVEPFDNEMLESIHVSAEPWVAMIPAAHPLAALKGDTIELRQLKDCPLIIPSRKSRTQEIKGWFGKIGLEPRILCEISHYLNAYELVRQGVGIAICPASTGAALDNQSVVSKSIVNPQYIANYALVWDKSRKPSPLTEKFISFVREVWIEYI